MVDCSHAKELEYRVILFEKALVSFEHFENASLNLPLQSHNAGSASQTLDSPSNQEHFSFTSLRTQLSQLKRYLSTYTKSASKRPIPVSHRASAPARSIRIPNHTVTAAERPSFIAVSPPARNLSGGLNTRYYGVPSIIDTNCSSQRSSDLQLAPTAAANAFDQSTTKFLARVEAALRMSDVDSPGSKTGAPPSPHLDSIRRSREDLIDIWSQFYALKDKPLSRDTREFLRHPSFNNWIYSDAELLTFVRFFFVGDEEGDSQFRLTNHLSVPHHVLDTWLCAVYSHYNLVPFHNFKHAFMVCQMMFATINQADLASLFSHLDLFVLLFAALCHDLDHPGLTNFYQNNVQSRLSICYNTNSPLENHHCAVALDLIRTSDTNVFMGVSSADAEIAKQLILRCILGTDMAKHGDILAAFREKLAEHLIGVESNTTTNINHLSVTVENGSYRTSSSSPSPIPNFPQPKDTNEQREAPPSPSLTMQGGFPSHSVLDLADLFRRDEELRAMTFVILLKMCDISTEIRPTPVSSRWLDCLMNEFSAQVCLERQNSLPLSPIVDSTNINQCQCSFLTFAMIPLAQSIVSIIPNLQSSFLTPAQTQLVYYSKLALEEQARATINEDINVDDAEATRMLMAKEDVDADSVEEVVDTMKMERETRVDSIMGPIVSIGCAVEPPVYSRTSHSLSKVSRCSSPFGNYETPSSLGEGGSKCMMEAPLVSLSTKCSCVSIPYAQQRSAPVSVQFTGDTRDRSPTIRIGDTTVVSSAGVAEFHSSPRSSLRPTRRSLGELPWARGLHQEYSDGEKWYLGTTPPRLRQSLFLASPFEMELEKAGDSKSSLLLQQQQQRNSNSIRSFTPPPVSVNPPSEIAPVRKISAAATTAAAPF